MGGGDYEVSPRVGVGYGKYICCIPIIGMHSTMHLMHPNYQECNIYICTYCNMAVYLNWLRCYPFLYLHVGCQLYMSLFQAAFHPHRTVSELFLISLFRMYAQLLHGEGILPGALRSPPGRGSRSSPLFAGVLEVLWFVQSR